MVSEEPSETHNPNLARRCCQRIAQWRKKKERKATDATRVRKGKGKREKQIENFPAQANTD